MTDHISGNDEVKKSHFVTCRIFGDAFYLALADTCYKASWSSLLQLSICKGQINTDNELGKTQVNFNMAYKII